MADLATADRAAGELVRELSKGHEPHPVLRQVLIHALQEGPPAKLGEARKTWQEARAEGGFPLIESLDNMRASAAWITATSAERGQALWDLLSLADAFPGSRAKRMRGERFPRLDQAP